MKGYVEKVLRVDLTHRTIKKESLDEKLIRHFVGGRGLNSKILYDEVKPGIDPLGSDNKIIISAGPCNGTIVPGSCRFTVTSKSPMTGILGDSNAGGFFGVELKYAGYDAIIIEGKSDKPVYLWVDDDTVELRSADHLWGKFPKDAMRIIQKENCDPDIFVISIGPAGENLVRFGNLITDLGRGLGRTGQGAVFGSKNLKAVAVRGSGGVRVARQKELHAAVKEIYQSWSSSDDKSDGYTHTMGMRAKYGPAYGWKRYEEFGMFSTKNFQGGTAGIKSMLDGLDEYFVKQKACFSCPAGCNHLFVIDKGPYAGTYGEGLENNFSSDFGPKMGNADMEFGVKLHALLDEYAMDYFETTTLMGFAMECYERGILTKEDTDGLELTWGDNDVVLKLIEKIVNKEGIGAILAEGVKRASEAIGKGAEYYAMQNKGQTIVGKDPRTSKGWGLMYAVSSRGPCHVRASFNESYPATMWDSDVDEILKKYKDPTNPAVEDGKAELVKWNEDMTAFKNSMEICLFALYPWNCPEKSTPKMLARLYSSVSGTNIDEKDVLHIGERIYNIEKAFNVREGLTRKDDTLPERFMKEPYPDGPAKGSVIDVEPMIDDYYDFRGWDKITGYQSKDKLILLDLEDVADELESLGKLALL